MKLLLPVPVLLAVLVAVAAYGQEPGFPAPGGGRGGSDAMIKSDMALMAMDGSIPLRFANALDGRGIPDALVTVDGLGTYATDYRGIAVLPRIADGTYALTFSKEGFITTPVEFRVQLGAVVYNWYSVSPGLEGNAYRFVLDWGERPSDLDMHLERRGGYHISYGNMRSSADGSVTLDRDDRDGYGPETITLGEAELEGVYEVYVVDYSNLNSPGSTALSRSGAVLRVYREDRLIHSFTVPQGAGVRWNVFRIERNQISAINTLGR
ncbi:MAG: hypothetical protein LBQ35_02010 [Spirochaetaceae bacterium]|jgi:hypothetical protein|nr:hypothetical protein [Spirochaetaceae bacterium]